jgi:asparagine synthase (glutamine-hydrolysing)
LNLDSAAGCDHVTAMKAALRGTFDRLWTQLHVSAIGRQVRARNLTYLSPRKLRALEGALRRVRRDRVDGDFLEFGVALGGSAIMIASSMHDGWQFHGYDVFGMIPPPGPCDDMQSHLRYHEIREGRSSGIGGETYYGYLDDLYDRVCRSFAQFGLAVDGQRIALHRGDFGATLDRDNPRPVAFAHIDCDWYESVRTCLDAIGHRMAVGGRVVLDDYNDYGGCRSALRDFLAGSPWFTLEATEPSAVIRRNPTS